MKTGSKKHIMCLAGFAGATLQILQSRGMGDDKSWPEVWDRDTLDKIASAAKDWQLAGTTPDDEFQIINHDEPPFPGLKLRF